MAHRFVATIISITLVAILTSYQFKNEENHSSLVLVDQIPELATNVFVKNFGTTTTIATDIGKQNHYSLTFDKPSYCHALSLNAKELIVSVLILSKSVPSLSKLLSIVGVLASSVLVILIQLRRVSLVDNSTGTTDTTRKRSKIVQIFVNGSGRKLPYTVDLYMTVKDLKQKITELSDFDASILRDQYLTFQGKIMSDTELLLNYNVQMYSTLFLSGRILGGANQARFCAGARQRERKKNIWMKKRYYVTV